MSERESPRPVLRVLHGAGDADLSAELAALVAVLAARPAAAAAVPAASRSAWADRSRSMRSAVVPGPGAWRASGLPA